MPIPYIDSHQFGPQGGQSFSATGRDMNSPSDEDSILNADDKSLLPTQAKTPKVRFGKAPKPTKEEDMKKFLDTYGRAADQAGVPKEWLSDPNLWALLKRESGSTPGKLNPVAQSRSSTARGIFQFLDGTYWKKDKKGHKVQAYAYPKTDDPYKQFVNGLQYIKAAYGTPKHAWDVWQQHEKSGGAGWY